VSVTGPSLDASTSSSRGLRAPCVDTASSAVPRRAKNAGSVGRTPTITSSGKRCSSPVSVKTSATRLGSSAGLASSALSLPAPSFSRGARGGRGASTTSTRRPVVGAPCRVVTTTCAPRMVPRSARKVRGLPSAAGSPASERAMPGVTLLGNASPVTSALPPFESTTSVFSASSRWPGGTGSDVRPPATPSRSK
jgi:hypothetical protein